LGRFFCGCLSFADGYKDVCDHIDGWIRAIVNDCPQVIRASRDAGGIPHARIAFFISILGQVLDNPEGVCIVGWVVIPIISEGDEGAILGIFIRPSDGEGLALGEGDIFVGLEEGKGGWGICRGRFFCALGEDGAALQEQSAKAEERKKIFGEGLVLHKYLLE